MQCGWPMHKFCYKKSKIVRKNILIYLIIFIFCPHRAALEFATTSTLCQAKDSLAITTSQSKKIQFQSPDDLTFLSEATVARCAPREPSSATQTTPPGLTVQEGAGASGTQVSTDRLVGRV